MKMIKHGLIWVMTVVFLAVVGCGGSESQLGKGASLRCVYKVGDVQKIRLQRQLLYRSWVEMPDKEPAESGMRKTFEELIVKREVESVAPDGTAVMKVTFEKAVMAVETKKSQNLFRYSSDMQNTETTNSQEPKLAGVFYRIRIAPDTSILEITGLEEQRKELKFDETTKGVVSNWLSEKSIRRLHERDFIKQCPIKATYNQTYESLVSIPDPMVKARAIRKTYTIGSSAVKELVTVTTSGEAAYKVPDGFPAAPKPPHMGAMMIVNASEMNELDIEGTGTFDLATATIQSDTYRVNCTLVISGDTLFGQTPKPGQEGKGGEMFTTIEFSETYELLP